MISACSDSPWSVMCFDSGDFRQLCGEPLARFHPQRGEGHALGALLVAGERAEFLEFGDRAVRIEAHRCSMLRGVAARRHAIVEIVEIPAWDAPGIPLSPELRRDEISVTLLPLDRFGRCARARRLR
jgi:hypothetical protein